MDQTREVKFNGWLKSLVCHGATPINMHVIVLVSIHWIPPYLDLPYTGIGDGSTWGKMVLKYMIYLTTRIHYKMRFEEMHWNWVLTQSYGVNQVLVENWIFVWAMSMVGTSNKDWGLLLFPTMPLR